MLFFHYLFITVGLLTSHIPSLSSCQTTTDFNCPEYEIILDPLDSNRVGDKRKEKQENFWAHIDEQTNYDNVNECKETLLHQAVKENKFKIACKLLKKGIDICAQNNRGETALHYAVDYDNAEIVLLLECYSSIYQTDLVPPFFEIKDHHGATALMHAVVQNKLTIASHLINLRADVFTLNNLNHGLLHFVKNPDLTQKLIVMGLDVNLQGRFKHTPLHFAHNEEVAQILIDHSAKVNALTDEENTPLHCANTTAVAQVLVDAGTAINFENIYGCTPLYYAVKNYNVQRCRFLLENNATLAQEKTGNIIDILQDEFKKSSPYMQENFKDFCKEQNLFKDYFFIHQAYPNTLLKENEYNNLRKTCSENAQKLMNAEEMSKIEDLHRMRMSQITTQIRMSPEQIEEYNSLVKKFNDAIKISIPQEEFIKLKQLHNRFMCNNKVNAADCACQDLAKKELD